jgi:hypothetical protein
MNETVVAIIIGLFFFVSLGTVRAVQRPPYPVKAEKPGTLGVGSLSAQTRKQDEISS